MLYILPERRPSYGLPTPFSQIANNRRDRRSLCKVIPQCFPISLSYHLHLWSRQYLVSFSSIPFLPTPASELRSETFFQVLLVQPHAGLIRAGVG